jgi:hypothetical protein
VVGGPITKGGGGTKIPKWPRQAKVDSLVRKIANKIKLIIKNFFIFNYLHYCFNKY